MKNWGWKEREQQIAELSDHTYDLLIIGGGITGAGILLDAASRGLKAVLVEKDDFASGTSSRSTKLIHGGLRYLKQLEIKIVRETGQERAIAHRNAPHLVIPEKMILPIQKGGTYGKFMTSIALKAYDWLAGVKGDDKRKMLNREVTLQTEPLLKPDLLKGSGFYSEYRTDDARLTIEVIKTAIQQGAIALNYTNVIDLIYEKGKVAGAKVKDEWNGGEVKISAKQVVNATGPWSDELRVMDDSMNHKRLHLTKGVHIVFDHERFPIKHSVYFDVPGGRMVFAIPRGKVTYVGTTDTNYADRKDNPLVTLDDVNYLLIAANNMFPELDLQLKDVKSSWAGLRPLIHEEGKSPSELSRTDEVFLSPTGMITIAGGKLTGYRLMAKKVVDEVSKRLNSHKPCTTDRIQINGYPDKELSSHLAAEGLSKIESSYLTHVYGQQSLDVLKAAKDQGIELIQAEALFCMHVEMCLNPFDFYVRRTGRMYFDIDSVRSSKDKIGKLFASQYNWTEDKLKEEIDRVDHELKLRSSFE